MLYTFSHTLNFTLYGAKNASFDKQMNIKFIELTKFRMGRYKNEPLKKTKYLKNKIDKSYTFHKLSKTFQHEGIMLFELSECLHVKKSIQMHVFNLITCGRNY